MRVQQCPAAFHVGTGVHVCTKLLSRSYRAQLEYHSRGSDRLATTVASATATAAGSITMLISLPQMLIIMLQCAQDIFIVIENIAKSLLAELSPSTLMIQHLYNIICSRLHVQARGRPVIK
jgi:hypothetical protein